MIFQLVQLFSLLTMMTRIMTLLVFFHTASAAQHFLRSNLFAVSGVPDVPEFVNIGIFDDVTVGYCDSNKPDIEPRTPWIKELFRDAPEHEKWLTSKCRKNIHKFKDKITGVMQRFNHSEGVHVFQRSIGCSWDDKAGVIGAFIKFGYDGEDLISFDVESSTWITPKHQTIITKHNWDSDGHQYRFWTQDFSKDCEELFHLYLKYGNSFIQTAVLPSVSLLQKTSSSLVSCHATGFYPNKAVMFWSKNGEKMHENVDHFESLHNNDGTFQMSVDLNISSIPFTDWNQFKCVFQFSDFQQNVITRLDKAIIKTNHGSFSRTHVAFIIPLLGLGLLASAFVIWKIRNVIMENR